MKRNTILQKYTILVLITIILVISHIIFIGNYQITKKIVKYLHQKKIENINNITKNIEILTENDSKKFVKLANLMENFDKIHDNINKSANYLQNQQRIKRYKRDIENSDLKELIKCRNRDYKPQIIQYGNYWVLKNFIRAGHGEVKCYETLTYTTHAHYTFLENLVPLVEKWRAPVSLAIYAPIIDFQITIDSISYLRNCLHHSHLIRQFVTFHLYFNQKNIPVNIPKPDTLNYLNCPTSPPYIILEINHKSTSPKRYPVNVGRNIARDAAQTYFILDSEIDLVPISDLPKQFLTMITHYRIKMLRKSPRVFSLPVFKIKANSLPETKGQLQTLLFENKALPFYERVCVNCIEHLYLKWMQQKETKELDILDIPKFNGGLSSWRPVYISTNDEPYYDNRLSWDGRSERILQTYLLCLLNYDIYVLNNVFLMYSAATTKDIGRLDKYIEIKTKEFVNNTILREFKKLFGRKKHCRLFL